MLDAAENRRRENNYYSQVPVKIFFTASLPISTEAFRKASPTAPF